MHQLRNRKSGGRFKGIYKSSPKLSLLVAAIFILVGLAITASVASVFYIAYGTGGTVTMTVKEKERITKGSGEDTTSQYMIFTEEGEVFKNTDTVLKGKFDSSDLQGKLTVGNKYECNVNGYRIRWMSEYRNLLDCKAVSAK